MVRKHFKEFIIALGLIVALLITNYVCLTPTPVKSDKRNVQAQIKVNNKQTKYVPIFTEVVLLTTKMMLKPRR
ncbi:hypothetical protein FNH22_24915 [Fulvivirga sp. M361]|uniref:hypothetical protein n=1 Tax=Fulvivirga sp. M361 TaxID=2594266 RepID=UPI00117A4239|nr:hypothetical protein [Fulvivirga sp. M361]TRX50897.1 hypothetical protein FNH22_24915 [Fulvivirga sp. M361]